MERRRRQNRKHDLLRSSLHKKEPQNTHLLSTWFIIHQQLPDHFINSILPLVALCRKYLSPTYHISSGKRLVCVRTCFYSSLCSPPGTNLSSWPVRVPTTSRFLDLAVIRQKRAECAAFYLGKWKGWWWWRGRGKELYWWMEMEAEHTTWRYCYHYHRRYRNDLRLGSAVKYGNTHIGNNVKELYYLFFFYMLIKENSLCVILLVRCRVVGAILVRERVYSCMIMVAHVTVSRTVKAFAVCFWMRCRRAWHMYICMSFPLHDFFSPPV